MIGIHAWRIEERVWSAWGSRTRHSAEAADSTGEFPVASLIHDRRRIRSMQVMPAACCRSGRSPSRQARSVQGARVVAKWAQRMLVKIGATDGSKCQVARVLSGRFRHSSSGDLFIPDIPDITPLHILNSHVVCRSE